MRYAQALVDWFERKKQPAPSLFGAGSDDLPWRIDPTPYKVYISEIMLQQTRVNTVIPYYNRWLERFPSLQEVAKASEEEILTYWQGLGYYRRAKNIHHLAKALKPKGFVFPSTKHELLQLPGVGEYTAHAILSYAFRQSYLALDANLIRIGQRLAGDLSLKNAALSQAFSPLLEKYPSDLINAALMDLGRTICTSQAPKCKLCPLQTSCLSFPNPPTPIKKAKLTEGQLVYFLLPDSSRHQSYLLVQSSAWWKSMYSFPYLLLDDQGRKLLADGDYKDLIEAWIESSEAGSAEGSTLAKKQPLAEGKQPKPPPDQALKKLLESSSPSNKQPPEPNSRFKPLHYQAQAFITKYKLKVQLIELPPLRAETKAADKDQIQGSGPALLNGSGSAKADTDTKAPVTKEGEVRGSAQALSNDSDQAEADTDPKAPLTKEGEVQGSGPALLNGSDQAEIDTNTKGRGRSKKTTTASASDLEKDRFRLLQKTWQGKIGRQPPAVYWKNLEQAAALALPSPMQKALQFLQRTQPAVNLNLKEQSLGRAAKKPTKPSKA